MVPPNALDSDLPAYSPLFISNASTLLGGSLLTAAVIISARWSSRAPDDAASVAARE